MEKYVIICDFTGVVDENREIFVKYRSCSDHF